MQAQLHSQQGCGWGEWGIGAKGVPQTQNPGSPSSPQSAAPGHTRQNPWIYPFK